MAVSSIFFIDDRIQDKEALFSAIDASTKWFVLDSSLDGINQIQRILSSYRNLDSVQIISHGSTGAINIGSTVLNSTNLTYYQTQLQTIGSSLKETGDLLLYGCDVAKGDEGQKFISDLAKVTGADVNTSNDLTGALILNQSLSLESSTGHIQTATIQPAVFNNVFAAGTIEESITNDTSTSGHDVGNVTGYTHITTSTDTSGNSSSSTNRYDANWKVTESAYTDSSGNKSVTQYQTSTDADGNVTGYTHITTSTDTSGNSSSSTNNYDTIWTLTGSGFTYISGNTSNSIDANNDGIIGALSSIDSSGSVDLSVDSVGNIFAGNVAVKTYSSQQIHTGIYGTEWTALAAETIGDVNTVLWQHESGALHTWQTDANWQWVSSEGWWGFGSTEFDTAESNFGIDANNDGIIGALSSIELIVCEPTAKEIVPVICICWDEDNPYYSIPKDIALIAVTDENITSRSMTEGFTINTLNADLNYSTLISDIGNGQSRDAGNDVLAFNSTTASNIDAIVDFVMATDNIQINNSIFANSEMLDAGLVKNQFFNDQDINSSVADTSYYDPDGSFSGAPVQITILGVQTQPTVAYSDFAVIA